MKGTAPTKINMYCALSQINMFHALSQKYQHLFENNTCIMKLSTSTLLVIFLHIFNLVFTKLNIFSARIWPSHLRSLVPKNMQAIVPFLWLGLICGMGFRAMSVQLIIWTSPGSKTNLNPIFFHDSSSALCTL